MTLAAGLDALADRLEREARDLRERAQRLREPSVPAAGEKRYLRARDVAELLQIDVRTVRRWREQGLLPEPIAIAGVVRWDRRVVDEWLAASSDQPSQVRRSAG